jgi:hypothetical protein
MNIHRNFNEMLKEILRYTVDPSELCEIHSSVGEEVMFEIEENLDELKKNLKGYDQYLKGL